MVDTNNPNNFPLSSPAGGGGDPFGSALQLLIANIQDVVQAINNLNVILQTVFPQQGVVAATASAGTGTLPATPQGFLVVTINGTEYTVPLYLP